MTDLVDELATVLVVLVQHLEPELMVHALDDVRAWTLNREWRLVQSTRASSHWPRL